MVHSLLVYSARLYNIIFIFFTDTIFISRKLKEKNNNFCKIKQDFSKFSMTSTRFPRDFRKIKQDFSKVSAKVSLSKISASFPKSYIEYNARRSSSRMQRCRLLCKDESSKCLQPRLHTRISQNELERKWSINCLN